MYETVRYLTGQLFQAAAFCADRQDRPTTGRRTGDANRKRERGRRRRCGGGVGSSAMFTWGMMTGLAEHNPLIGAYTPDAVPSRDRVLSDTEMAGGLEGLRRR